MKCKSCGADLPYNAFGDIRCQFCNAPNYVPIPEGRKEVVERVVVEKKGSSKGLLVLIILIIVIGVGIAFSGNEPSSIPKSTSAPVTIASTRASEDLVDIDPSKGPENAPITIVEFSDFQCPFCAKAAPVVQQIVDTYGDKVRIVYRDFPLSSIHPDAQKAAEAAECADDQGKFWEFHDLLYANQDKMSVNDLKQFAKNLGLDSNTFDKCLDSGKHEVEVKKDMQDGINMGVTGTPSFFINGQYLSGAQPFLEFQQIIDSMLSLITTPDQISPADGTVFNHYPRKTALIWSEVPGASHYTLELQYCSSRGCDDWVKALSDENPLLTGLTTTSYTFDFVGAQPGRWRVWAVVNGVETPKTDWWEFKYIK